EPLRGDDSFVGRFSGPGFQLGFDYGLYSNDLHEMRADPRFVVDSLVIDGRPAIVATGPSVGPPYRWGCAAAHLTALYVSVSPEPYRDERSLLDRLMDLYDANVLREPPRDPRTFRALEMDGCAESAEAIDTLHIIFRSLRFPSPPPRASTQGGRQAEEP